jgi:cholesterol transport system auxiliary component
VKVRPVVLVLAAALVVVSTSGCALLTKQSPVSMRYFSPEPPRREAPAKSGAPAGELRLGSVSSGAHLRERIVYRGPAYELGFYDDRRWTERPEAYVRRELARALFDERGFRRVLGATAPTLEIEVIAFEEVRLESGVAGRVELRVQLHDDARVLLEETIRVDRPASGGTAIEDVVAALGSALDEAARLVADRVSGAAAARSEPAALDE